MPTYLVAYHGGTPSKAADRMADYMARWKRWSDGLGDALGGGSILGRSIRLTDGAGGSVDPDPDRLTGYYLLTADSLETAERLLRACPIFEVGGSVQIAEQVEMNTRGCEPA